MGKKFMDTYHKWEHFGKLKEILDFIKTCQRCLVSQTEMCKHLGIKEDTFIRLKRKYPVIEKALLDAKMDLKKDLVGALYKRATGYSYTDEVHYIEDSGSKSKKRRVVKTTKHVPDDKYSAVYLLIKYFGRDFSDRSYELALLEARLNANTEE